MEHAQFVSDSLFMLRRRKTVIGVITGIGMALSVLYALVATPQFLASAHVLVERQKIPDDLVRSTVNLSAEERLSLIGQRLMSRENLASVIERLNLYADRPDLTLRERILDVREATRITPIREENPQQWTRGEITSFTVDVVLNDAEQAAALANELVSSLLQQNVRTRSARARDTVAFFATESERLGRALDELDARIMAFKVGNARDLPDSIEFRRSELARLDETRLEIDRRLLEIEEQRGLLEAGAVDDDGLSLPASTASAAEEELRRLEIQLAQLANVYASTHPTIISLRRKVRGLRAQVEGSDDADADLVGDALSRRRLSQEDALERQIALLDTQVTLLNDQKAAIAARRDALEASIGRTPNVESQLNALERQRLELSERYAAVARKRAEAETAQQLEINQQAERFEIIEHALVPEGPFAPSRKVLVAVGTGLSMGLALAAALFLEMMNPALRNSAQMQRLLGVRPFVSIPEVRTRRERRRRRGLVFAVLGAILVGVTLILTYVDRNVSPLRGVVSRLADRTGASDLIRAIQTRF